MKKSSISLNITVIKTLQKKTTAVVSLVLILFVSLFLNKSFAQVNITIPSIFDTATCKFPTPYVALGNIVISETAMNNFATTGVGNKTLILTISGNFQFNPGLGSVSGLSADITILNITTITSNAITIALKVINTATLDVLTISGLQVRGTNSPGVGSLKRLVVGSSGGTATITGDVFNTNHASFTSVVRDPVILVQPTAESICVGASTNFSVSTQVATISYLWQENQGSGFTNLMEMTPYTGTASSLLNISNALLGMSGYQYRCIVTGTQDVCTSNSAYLTVNPPPGIIANPVDATVCEGLSSNFSVAAVGGNLQYSWYESTDGGFSYSLVPFTTPYFPFSSSFMINPTPGAFSTNQYYCIVGDGNVCGGDVSSLPAVLSVDPEAIVDAGLDDSICSGNNYLLSGAIGGAATSLTWSTTGNGLFNNASAANAIYAYGSVDSTMGTVNLVITTNDPPGLCLAKTDTLVLLVDQAAVVSASLNATICYGSTYALSGTRGGAALSSAWTSSGDGSFNDSSLVNAVYTHGSLDSAMGAVTLTITTDNPPGICPAVSDAMVLTINYLAKASAGLNDTICSGDNYVLLGSISGSATSSTWTTSGDGSFNDSSLVNAIYTNGPADSASGMVTLTITTNDPLGPCASHFDAMSLYIRPAAFATASLNDTICSGSTIVLSGQRAGAATSSIWTSSGDGTFSDSSLVNAIYTHGIIDSTMGNVTLTITTNNPIGVCPSVFDDMLLSVNPLAKVTAGLNDTICSSTNFLLSGSISGGASSLTWTSSGDGNFNDSSLFNAVYTHGIADSTNGFVILTITTNDPSGPCLAVADNMVLAIKPEAKLSTLLDDTICSGETYPLSALIAGAATSVTWTSSGDGYFNDSSLVNAIYTSGIGDSTMGFVTLTITTNDPVGICTALADSMTLSINPLAQVAAGIDFAICTGSSYTLNGSRTGGASSSTWTTSGDGSFNDSSIVNAIYTYGSSDSINGSVFLKITSNDPVGICAAAKDSMMLTINPKPFIITVTPAAICSPAFINLTSPAVTLGSTGGLTYNYFTDSAATIHVIDSTQVITSGMVYIVGITALGCSDTAGLYITVNPQPSLMINQPAAVCLPTIVDLTLPAITAGSSSGITLNYFTDAQATIVMLDSSNVLLSGTYYILATTSLGCTDTAAVNVNIQLTAVGGTVVADAFVCAGANGDTLKLTGSVGTIQKWQYSVDLGMTWVDTANTSTQQIYSNITTTTWYRAMLSETCASAISIEGRVTVDNTPLPIGGFASSILDTVCSGSNNDTIKLTGYSGLITQWEFSTDNGVTWLFTADSSANFIFNNLTSTTIFHAIVQYSTCNVDTSSNDTITVIPASNAGSIIAVPAVCANFNGDTLILQGALGSVINWQYSVISNTTWIDIANTTEMLIFANLSDTIFYRTIVKNGVCNNDTTEAAAVYVYPKPDALFTVDSVCFGSPTNFTNISTIEIGALQYQWDFGDSFYSFSISPSHIYGFAGMDTATLIVKSLLGCADTMNTSIVVFPNPTADAGADNSISLGDSYLLNGQGGLIYSWQPATGLSNQNISNPAASPDVTTIYELTVADLNGCTDIDLLTLTVISDINLIVSNLMTANGDGYNDKWIVNNIGAYPGTEAIVVNREGQQVYYSSSYDNSWNGMNKNGKALPDGTYYYFLKLKDTLKIIKGSLTILNEK